MVTICYETGKDGSLVTVRGHAGAGEYGHDLVCAGVSILVWTLANALVRLEMDGAVTESDTKLEAGDAELRFRWADERAGEVTLVVEAIVRGFQILAARSPEYVRYERREMR